MKKLLSILTAIGIIATTGSTVVSCGDKGTKESNNSNKKDLSALPVKSLGNIEGDNDLPDLSDIVKKIKALNKDYDLKTSDIDFVESPTTSKASLKAKDTSELFMGTVEVTYSYNKSNQQRTNFDIGLVSQVIDNQGIGAVARPNEFNVGFLMVENKQNRDKIVDDLRKFINRVVDMAQALYPNVTTEAIMNMVEVSFFDVDGKEIKEDGKDITQIKGTVKEGHANDMDGIHAFGEVLINIKQYKSLAEHKFDNNWGEIVITDVNDDFTTKNTLLSIFKSKNEQKIKDFPYDQLEVRQYDLKSGTANLGIQINGDYSQENISVSFTVKETNGQKIGQFNLSTWTDGSIYYQFMYDDSIDEDLNTQIVNYLYDIENNIEYWENFSSVANKYFFKGQKSEGSSSVEDGTVDKQQFINDFDSIITLDKNDDNSDITITFKTEAQNKYDGYVLMGSANITNEPNYNYKK